jgi:hypothetical protein
MKNSSKVLATFSIAGALALAAPALIVQAAPYAYPGAKNCGSGTVVTAAYTSGPGYQEHRVTGFGGDYYAYFNNDGYHSKPWGYHQVLASRVGVMDPYVGTLYSSGIGCV